MSIQDNTIWKFCVGTIRPITHFTAMSKTFAYLINFSFKKKRKGKTLFRIGIFQKGFDCVLQDHKRVVKQKLVCNHNTGCRETIVADQGSV